MEAHEHNRGLEQLEHKVRAIERKLSHMATQDEVDKLAEDLGTVKSGLATVASDVSAAQSTLQQEINDLAKANPRLDLSGIENATADIVAAVDPLDEAVKGLDKIQPVQAAPPGGGGGGPTSSPEKAVYLFDASTGATTDERFSPSGFETVPAVEGEPEVLLYFSGDTGPGQTNGSAVPGYTVYDGAIRPVA